MTVWFLFAANVHEENVEKLAKRYEIISCMFFKLITKNVKEMVIEMVENFSSSSALAGLFFFLLKRENRLVSELSVTAYKDEQTSSSSSSSS